MPIVVQTLTWDFTKNHLLVYSKTKEGCKVAFSLTDYKLPIYISLENLSSQERHALEFEIRSRYQLCISEVLKTPFQNSIPIASLSLQKTTFLKKRFLKIETTSKEQFEKVRTFLNYIKGKYLHFNHSSSTVLMKNKLSLFNTNIMPIQKFFMEYPEINPCGWFSIEGINLESLKKQKFVQHNAWRNINFDVSLIPSSKLHLVPLKGNEDQCPLRICSFDFETTGTKSEYNLIYQAGITFETVYGDSMDVDIQRYLLNVGPCLRITDPPTNVQTFANEKDFLIGFINLLTNVEWDALTGYNIFGFDLEMLQGRLKFHRLTALINKLQRFQSVRGDFPIVYKEKKSGKGEGYMDLVYVNLLGRIVLDLMPMMKKYDNKLRSYSLNATSNKYLGEQKMDLTYKEMRQLYKNGNAEDFWKIGVYCIQDTKLPIGLLKKLDLLIYHVSFCNVAHFPLNLTFTYGEQIKIYSQIYSNASPLGFIFHGNKDAKESDTSDEGFEGATVLEPKPGVYENAVACLDFMSLYPSIMIRYNLCPSTYIDHTKLNANEKELLEEAVLQGKVLKMQTDAGFAYFVQRNIIVGVIPGILIRLLAERGLVKKEMKKFEKGTFTFTKLNNKQLALVSLF